jgi:homoserine O-acetyltransferase
MLYMNKACSLFDVGRGFHSFEEAEKSIKAKDLMIGSDTDVLFPVSEIKSEAEIFGKAGKDVSHFEIKIGFCHLSGLLAITQAAPMITWFMENLG